MANDRSAAALLREVGLLADGPVVWGRALPPTGAGVFLIELASPQATAPLELTRVGKWLERVPGLRLDGERPDLASAGGAARVVLAAVAAGPLHRLVRVLDQPPGRGDHLDGPRRSTAGGRRTLAPRPGAPGGGPDLVGRDDAPSRSTRTPCSTAFAAGIPAEERAALPDTAIVLPFANLDASTGERKATGLIGSLIRRAGRAAAAADPRRAVPDGDAEGANGEPPEPKRAAGRARRAAKAGDRARAPAPRATAAAGAAARRRRPAAGADLGDSADGAARLRGRARRARPGPPARGHRPDQGGQGARRPQGERRLHVGSRGAVVPRGPDPGDRGAASDGRHRRGRRRGGAEDRPRVARDRRGRRRAPSDLHDRRLDRGGPGRGPDLERLTGRPGADGRERRRRWSWSSRRGGEIRYADRRHRLPEASGRPRSVASGAGSAASRLAAGASTRRRQAVSPRAGSTSLCSTAQSAAWVRDASPSLPRMFET